MCQIDNTSVDISKAITENFWSIYSLSTATLSNVCRQLAFAEGGVCWFFKYPTNQACFSENITSILMYLILFFAADVLQCLISSIVYWIFGKYYESQHRRGKLKDTSKVYRKWYMNIFSIPFFVIKLIMLTYASCSIVIFLVK